MITDVYIRKTKLNNITTTTQWFQRRRIGVLFDLKIYRTINNPSSYMEIKEEDYDTIVTLRIPISLAKAILKMDWGLPRKQKGNKAEVYRTCLQTGIQFKTVRDLHNDPDQKAEFSEKMARLLTDNSPEQIFETMDVRGLEDFMVIANMVKDRKINQMLLDT